MIMMIIVIMIYCYLNIMILTMFAVAGVHSINIIKYWILVVVYSFIIVSENNNFIFYS